jgi:hypothetical protein
VNIAGQTVCTSGSYLGERCSAVIRRVNVSYRAPVTPRFALKVVGGVYALSPGARDLVNARGNSGGPVFRRVATTRGAVVPLGTISAGLVGRGPCMVYDAQTCFRDVYYANLRTLLNDYGADLA